MRFKFLKKRKFWLTSAFVIFYLLWFTLPKIIIEIKHPIIRSVQFINGDIKRQEQKLNFENSEDWNCISFDGLKLSGTYILADSAKANIILVHGIRSSRYDYHNRIPDLLALGCNVLAIDLRAHGKSEGRYCTFGIKEKKDIDAWIKMLEQKNNVPIAIWGHSLGGAVALQSIAENDKIKFAIIESTFCNLHQISKDYFQRFFGFRADKFMDFLLWRADHIAEIQSQEANVSLACKRIHIPIFYAHGDKDKSINMEYGKINFENLASTQKEFNIVKDAGHNTLAEKGGETYRAKWMRFMQLNIEKNELGHHR